MTRPVRDPNDPNPFPPEPQVPCVVEQPVEPTADDPDEIVEQVKSNPLAGPTVKDL